MISIAPRGVVMATFRSPPHTTLEPEKASRYGICRGGRSARRVTPLMRSAPFSWIWSEGAQKFCGSWCWQAKNPACDISGEAAKAMVNATLASLPSGRLPGLSKKNGAKSADAGRIKGEAIRLRVP